MKTHSYPIASFILVCLVLLNASFRPQCSINSLNVTRNFAEARELLPASNQSDLIEDAFLWMSEALQSPDFALREKEDRVVSYAQTLATCIAEDHDFFTLNRSCKLPLKDRSSNLNYQLDLPLAFNWSGETYPLVIDLPGVGWIKRQLAYERYPSDYRSGNIITVIPINDRFGKWDIQKLDKLLAHLKSKLPIDEQRIYAIGHSIGGDATWRWAKRRPETFAAISPWSTWASQDGSERLRNMPVMIVHGERDLVIPPTLNLNAGKALRKLGGHVETRLVPSGHFLDTAALRTDTIAWFLQHRRRSH